MIPLQYLIMCIHVSKSVHWIRTDSNIVALHSRVWVCVSTGIIAALWSKGIQGYTMITLTSRVLEHLFTPYVNETNTRVCHCLSSSSQNDNDDGQGDLLLPTRIVRPVCSLLGGPLSRRIYHAPFARSGTCFPGQWPRHACAVGTCPNARGDLDGATC